MCKERTESWRNEKIEELERKHKTKDKLKKMATKTISKSGTNCIRDTSGRMLFDDVINIWVEHVLSCLVLSCLVLSCLVLSCVLANTPMESNGQGWVAWSSLVVTSKEPVCPRVELILKIIIIFLGFIKSKPC